MQYEFVYHKQILVKFGSRLPGHVNYNVLMLPRVILGDCSMFRLHFAQSIICECNSTSKGNASLSAGYALKAAAIASYIDEAAYVS